MAYPNPPSPFTNLPAGNNPISYLDTMFSALGNASIIACTASGTNVITLTPNANFFLPAAYTNYNTFAFAAVANSTGSVTALVTGLAAKKVFTPSGVQAGSGDIVNGSFYLVSYNGALDTGNGGFQILNATVSSIAQPIKGSFKNLKITNNAGTPNTKVDITADEVVLENAGGGTAKVSSVSLTCDFSTSAVANGLDAGGIAAAKFYYLYVIYNANSTTTASLGSLSSTAPTLPTGYTYYARVGAIPTAAGSAQFMGIMQLGRKAQYVVGLAQTTTAAGGPPNIANGTAGTYSGTSPTLASVTVAGNTFGSGVVVPSTASDICVMAVSVWKGAAAQNVLVAPNTSWGTTNSGPAGSLGFIWPLWITANGFTVTSWITLESTAIAWASSGAGGAISCLGWEDNL